MPKGLWVKVDANQTYKTVTGFWVKVSPNSWVSVSDAWVKVAPNQPYEVFYTAGTAPDSSLEIINTYDSSDRLRLQGVNKRWTPTPTTLQYKFVYIDPYTFAESDITSWTNTTNPSAGSSTTLPGTSSYVTIANGLTDPYWYPGVLNVYKFRVRGSTASGIYFTSEAEYSMRTPKAPTLSFTTVSSSSINLTINSYSVDDYIATGRYIVYAYDGTAYRYAGSAGGIVGLGGYTADTQSKTITISGLSTTKSYTFYVLPTTGSSGSTDTNLTGYRGLEASIDVQLQAQPPATPVISNITTSTDALGVKIEFDISLTSTGSSAIDYWEFNLNNGGWQRFNNTYSSVPDGYVFSNSSAELYVFPGTFYTVRVRATNLDNATSQQSNQLSITSASAPTEPTSVVVKSFTSNQFTVFFTAGQNTGSVESFAEYDSFNTFDYIENYINISQYSPGKIQLTGANSSSRSYMIYLKPWTGANKTGNQGSTTYYTNKTANGSDYMNISLGTPTSISGRTINLSWTLVSGSPTYYIANLIRFNTGAVVSTKTINENGTSANRAVSFNELDGVDYGTTYYIQVIPYYQYATGVTYFDITPVSSNLTTSVNLSAPTPTSVTFTAPSTINVSFSGGTGPYYQLWWSTTTGTVSGSSFVGYDAASTGTPITESLTPVAGSTYYFWVRSSSENLGNTTQGGSATSGTFSPWSSSFVSYTAPAPKLSTPTNVVASDDRSDGIRVSWTNVANAATYGVWWGSQPSYDNSPDFGGPNNNGNKVITSSPFLDDGVTTGTTRDYYVQAFPASNSTSFTKSDWSFPGDSGTRVAAATAPTGGSVSVNPATGTAGSTTYTASASGWTGTGTITYTYSWQYFSSSSFSWAQASTGSTWSPPSNVNTLYPNFGWQVVVTASNGVTPNGTASTSVTINSPAVVTAPGVPTSVGLTGSGSVSWGAPTSGGTPTSYEIEFYTARSSTGTGALPTGSTGYTVTGISSSPYQLSNQYASPNNYARVRVRARNSAGASSYSGWVPSATTYT